MQRHHRQRQAGTRAAQVHGDDGFVVEGFGPRCPGGREGLRQARRLAGRGGQHHRIERLAVHLPARARCGQRLHPVPQPQYRALLAQPDFGRCRQQRAQAGAGQQQVGAAGAAEEGIAQHPQEHASAGALGGRVEGGHAQRVDQVGAHPRRQSARQLGHGGALTAGKAAGAPAAGSQQQRRAVAPTPAAVSQHRPHEGGDGGTRRQLQAAAIGVHQGQRAAQQQLLGRGAHLAHQGQRAAVSADQDVLAVVQRQAVHRHLAGAAAQLRRHLEQRDLGAGADAGHRGGQAGPAAADDRHPGHGAWGHGQRACQLVRIAIHTLRSGVSAMRWCSTWKSLASISRSSVR